MDILNTLKEKGKELFVEELDFFVTELETGDYSETYVKECKDLINSIKNWKKAHKSTPKKANNKHDNINDILLSPSALIEGYTDSKKSKLSVVEQIKQEIEEIRKKSAYNKLFQDYVRTNAVLDENKIEELFKFFMQWELEELLEIKKFSEAFLEKYFSELDHSKIAKYQYFTEDFFIKHFNDLNYNTVLQKGVNEWRKKSNRSRKLDVFLRLKGVTI